MLKKNKWIWGKEAGSIEDIGIHLTRRYDQTGSPVVQRSLRPGHPLTESVSLHAGIQFFCGIAKRGITYEHRLMGPNNSKLPISLLNLKDEVHGAIILFC